MNDEIIFLHLLSYIYDSKLDLTEEEFKELDILAELMLEPNDNYHKLLDIRNNISKYRIMCGAVN